MTMGKEQTRGNIIFNTKDDFIIERDKARVSQAVSNLLNNAIKFTKEGSIMVSAERISDDNNNMDGEAFYFM
jgi:signal transduction histidine kinase